MADLFADSDDSLEEVALKTESEYAKKYDAWREKEEKHKLEQKYGENPSEADLESSDSEDDVDPPEVSEKLEKDFLKTLSLLKTQDPRIYDPKFNFFEEEEQKDEEKAIVKASVSSEKLKKDVKSLADAFGASDDEEDVVIFKVENPKERPENKGDKLKEFLTGKVEHIEDETEQDLKALKALWSDPKLNEGEAFLRDYILNKKYLEDDEQGPLGKLLDDADLEADEATVEEQGKFERAYNFRFEEPDQEFLKRYPRTIGGTRPKDDRRSRKRAEVRERKEAEKRKKMEEIARLKALKLKEIQQKIEQIKKVTGNKELAFQERDIEGDFDPVEHDRRMEAIFNEQYYGECDEHKPVFPDLDEELEIENWDKYEKEMGLDQSATSVNVPHCEDQDFNMDADYDPKRSRIALLEEIQQTLGKKRRNRKRKNKLAEILAKDKPKYDPTSMQKTYDEYMEEYYKMDCEDVIGGDLPTRFKYRQVVPNSYGLTVEEILLADDKDLNKWVSLKKTVKYRPEHVEKSEVKTYQIKAADVNLKKKLLPSLFKEIEEPKEEPVSLTANKKKKKKKKHAENIKEETGPITATTDEAVQLIDNLENKKKNNINKHTKIEHENQPQELVNNITKLELKRNKHFSNKKRKQDMNNTVNRSEDSWANNDSNLNDSTTEVLKSNKKKKRTKVQPSELPSTKEHIQNLNQKDYTVKDSTLRKDKNKIRKIKEAQTTETAEVKEIGIDNNRKRKILFNPERHGKNIKLSENKFKNKAIKNVADGLSDERLKAYGLNPKKYRNFLKHKKY